MWAGTLVLPPMRRAVHRMNRPYWSTVSRPSVIARCKFPCLFTPSLTFFSLYPVRFLLSNGSSPNFWLPDGIFVLFRHLISATSFLPYFKTHFNRFPSKNYQFLTLHLSLYPTSPAQNPALFVRRRNALRRGNGVCELPDSQR